MFEQLLAKIAKAFEAADLSYMGIGGQAVLLYGEARLTEDVDITLGAPPDALPRVLRLTEAARLTPLVGDPKSFLDEAYLDRWLSDFSSVLDRPFINQLETLRTEA